MNNKLQIVELYAENVQADSLWSNRLTFLVSYVLKYLKHLVKFFITSSREWFFWLI